MSLGNWEDRRSDEAKSGELPVWNYRLTHERWEGISELVLFASRRENFFVGFISICLKIA
jgi:hypothetical protein